MSLPKSSTPSLRDLCLDAIGAIAQAIQKSSAVPMTREQSVALAAQTPEGLVARRFLQMPGSAQPFTEVLAHMAKGEAFQEKASMRDVILAKKAAPAAKADAATDAYLATRHAQLAKLGTPASRARVTADPHTPKPGYVGQPIPAANPAPASTPADHIYAAIIEQARAQAAPGRSESGAVSDFLLTTAGQRLHANWNVARRLQDE